MKKIVKNVFNDGLQMDLHPYVSKNLTLSDGENMRLITQSGDELILQTEEGARLICPFPAGYVVMGSASYNGVCYILSAEINDGGEATGRGQIGCFPSPRYGDGEQGEMTMDYRPFKNLLLSSVASDFVSDRFNFSLAHPFTHEVQIQPDYDGTVNVWWSDDYNPPRVINSRFSLIDETHYKIIDRSGDRDTNLYTESSFDSLINAQFSSPQIMKVGFSGVFSGGVLKAGNYRYFFAYQTADGNKTQILAESFTVSVFSGDTPAAIYGGAPNETTDRSVRFDVSGLDSAFAYLKVYFTYSAGDDFPAQAAYEIESLYAFNGDSYVFTHSGFEKVQLIDRSELSEETITIGHCKTIAQVQNRMVYGNITEELLPVEEFSSFASTTLISSRQEKLSAPTLSDDASINSLYEPNNFSQGELAGFRHGYLNPHNIYHKLGYFGGESYIFGIRFILPSGALSPVFPLFGVDNYKGDKSTTTAPAYNYTADSGPATLEVDEALITDLNTNHSGFETFNIGANTRGVYRFPSRSAPTSDALLSNGQITINGVSFTLPAIPSELKKLSIGVVFVRGERKKDMIAQGYLTPTVHALLSAEDDYSHDQDLFAEFYNSGNEENIRVLPTIRGYQETANREGETEGKLDLHQFNRTGTDETQKILSDKRAAFFSPDAFLSTAAYISELNERELHLEKLAFVNASTTAATTNFDGFSIPSLYKTTSTEKIVSFTSSKVKAYFTQGGFSGTNAGRFSGSSDGKLRTKGQLDYKGAVLSEYNDYYGIDFKDSTFLELPTISRQQTTEAGFSGQDLSGDLTQAGLLMARNEPIAVLANLYPQDGPVSLAGLKERYSVENTEYIPISPRYSWAEVESMMDSSRKITCYGGDCFISPCYRRLYYNTTRDGFYLSDPVATVKIGAVLNLLTESSTNPALRRNEQVDINEPSKRSFLPYLGKDQAGDAAKKFSYYRENINKLPESKAQNKGYGYTFSEKTGVSLPQGVPYIARKFDTMVVASAVHENNGYSNGYRTLLPFTRQNYPRHKGAITALRTLSGELYCIQQHGVGVIGVNERIETGADSSGSIFLEAPYVLSPYLGTISDAYGSSYNSSIYATDNFIYGVDDEKVKIWRARKGEALQLLSDFSVSSYLQERKGFFRGKNPHVIAGNVITYYSRGKGEMLFSFYYKGEDVYESQGNFTMVYSETIDKWAPRLGAKMAHMMLVHDELYALPLIGPTSIYHFHDKEATGCNFFGSQQSAYLEYIVNEDVDIAKVFDNLQIVSNGQYPIKITYKNDRQSIEENITYASGILRDNAFYKENICYIQTGKFSRERIRDKYCRIRIYYIGKQKAFVHSVNTVFRHSFS